MRSLRRACECGRESALSCKECECAACAAVTNVLANRKRMCLLPPELSPHHTFSLCYSFTVHIAYTLWVISITLCRSTYQLGSIETGRRENCAALWVERQLVEVCHGSREGEG